MINTNAKKLQDYIEMLYEEIADKIKGTACILQLSNSAFNVKGLVENGTIKFNAWIQILRLFVVTA